ncbi:MAG: DUF4019 domain-containing protein [Pyrinomonadaceae bacterium]|nr:DUF4019 domain-containing protein [Pyrinomonadaceae bacterium]
MLAVTQTVNQDQIAFTVSDAPWMIMLDSKNLDIKDQQIKRDGKSGYFLLSNEKEGFTVSLFIEPAVKCKTSAECRDFVWKTGNPEWGKVQDVVQSKIGDVSYFEFFRPTVQGQPLQMLDMYAEFVEDGYWVDLHLSKVQYKKEDHLLLENFVKSIRFLSKTAKPTADTDKSIEAARKVAEDWMILWDSGKYKESYAGLASFTKKAFDEKTWFTYWTTARKPFGKLKSRKILQIQLVKSLPGIPDRSGAILRYLSSFGNQEDIFETFSVILEKDGTWRVASYNTNE